MEESSLDPDVSSFATQEEVEPVSAAEIERQLQATHANVVSEYLKNLRQLR